MIREHDHLAPAGSREARTEVIRGQAAFDLLDTDAFHVAWRHLCSACDWTTVFQTPEFLVIWYRVYAPRYEPVLICGWNEEGTLVGLLPLAIERGGQRLVAGGSYQAEYQTWIADPASALDFPAAAFDALTASFPRHPLTLQYIPAETPLDAFEPGGSHGTRAVIDTTRRGLMDVRTGDHEESLRKKGNRSRLKRLERIGPVELDRITTAEDLDALLARFGPYCDLRQGAAHGGLPFRDDPLQQELYRALLDAPGVLDVSALRCGTDHVSAHINVRNRDTVMLGVVAHAPFAAEHSPGKFHTLMLARRLAAEGCEAFDLTPGGDAYKDRFATRYDEVRTLRVFPSRTARARFALSRRLGSTVRGIVRRARVETHARALRSGIRDAVETRNGASVPVALARAARRWMGNRANLHLYSVEPPPMGAAPADPAIRHDRVDDLLLFRPEGARAQTRRAFLTLALRRLESGHHCHTVIEDGVLRAVWWSARVPGEVSLDEPWGTFRLSPGLVLLHDVRVWPRNRRTSDIETRGVVEKILGSTAVPENGRLLIAVDADDESLDRAVADRAGSAIATWHARPRSGRTTPSVAREVAESQPNPTVTLGIEPSAPVQAGVGATEP